MRKNTSHIWALPLQFAGSIFDLRGAIAENIRAYTSSRAAKRPKTTEEALAMDVEAIGRDMRKAMDKWKSTHA